MNGKQIGKRIKERRMQLGYTISDVAALTRLQYCTISRVEKAEVDAQIGTIGCILVALRMELVISEL